MSKQTVIIDGEEYVQLTITISKEVFEELDEEANAQDYDVESFIEEKLSNR